MDDGHTAPGRTAQWATVAVLAHCALQLKGENRLLLLRMVKIEMDCILNNLA